MKIKKIHHSSWLGVLVLMFVMVFVVNATPVGAFGISPSGMFFDNILPNSTVPAEVTFTRADASHPAQVTIDIQGEVVGLIELKDGKTITIKAGQQQFTYHFLIKPGNASRGKYKGTFTATQAEVIDAVKKAGSTSTTELSASARAVSGAQANVTIEVNNATVEKWNVVDMQIRDVEAKQNIPFTFLVKNTGNVDIKLGKIHLIIKEKDNPKNVKDEWIDTAALPRINGFSEQYVNVFSKTTLQPAYYYADVTIFDRNNKQIFKHEPTLFNVLPEGTLAKKGELVSLTLDKSGEKNVKINYELGQIVTIKTVFKNTGSVGLKPGLVIEIYKDDVRIDVIKAETDFVPVNQTGEFESNFQPKEGGEYTVKAYFSYGIAKTKIAEQKFSIPTSNKWMLIALLTGGSLLLAGAGLALRHWHAKKAPLQTSSSSTATLPPSANETQ